jgi:addiction module RelE/StbE family toxin
VTIRWTEAARADLRAIHGFYVDRSPAGAERVVGTILKAANGLMAFPLLGRVGRIEGTRERVLGRYPYRIVYTIEGATIVILRIRHSGQQS